MRSTIGQYGRQAWRARAVLAVALSFAALAPAIAQDVPETPAAREADTSEDVFVEAVDVTVVNVQTFVTDKDGRPVTGLSRDDFDLFEDGRPVDITNFYAVESGRRRPPPTAAPASPDAGQPTVSAVSQLTDPDDRLRLVILVDNVNIEAVHRNRVFREIRQFLLEELDSDDEVMLVSYERSLKVKQPFTSDVHLVSRTLFELEELSTNSSQARNERFELIRHLEESEEPGRVSRYIRNYAQSVQNDLSVTLRAMTELVRSLAGIPGRKALLYVSDGLPRSPGEDFYVALTHKYPRSSTLIEAQEFDASKRFRELGHLASSNRVAFYTLDAAGLRLSAAADVERSGATAGMVSALDAAYTNNVQTPLRYLATLTGGEAIINTNNPLPGLVRLAADSNNYYSLGYMPSHVSDGRYYRIEVRIKEKDKARGLTVRHREGYRDKPVSNRMSEALLSTLRWNYENNPLGIRLHFDPSSALESGERLVPLRVEIPLDRVILVPRGELHEGRVSLYIAVADESGRTAPVQHVPVVISIPSAEIDEALKRSFHYKVPLRMRTGRQRVAIGVRDDLGAAEAFVVDSVSVTG